MPDDHSEVVPLLPIPNRTVKRFSADDSAGSRVKVGHRQALTARKAQQKCWAFCFFSQLISGVENVLTVAYRRAGACQVVRKLVDPGDEVDFRKPTPVDH